MATTKKAAGTEIPEETAASAPVALARLELVTLTVQIEGVTPLIPHKWSEKSLRMMREAQMSGSKTRAKHDPKDPAAEAEGSLYRLADGRPGMPAVAFKAAMVAACRFYKGFPMTQAKVALFVAGEGADQLVAIEGDGQIREDTPRNNNGVPDLRYRYSFWPWRAQLDVTFVKSIVDMQSVLNLLDAGGQSGVGDWRPGSPQSHTGTFGRFRVLEGAGVLAGVSAR